MFAIVVTQKLFYPLEDALKNYIQTFKVHVTLSVNVDKCFPHTYV